MRLDDSYLLNMLLDRGDGVALPSWCVFRRITRYSCTRFCQQALSSPSQLGASLRMMANRSVRAICCNALPLLCMLVSFAFGAAIAQDIDEDELRKGEEWLASRAHEELIDTAKILMISTELLARSFDDEEFVSSTPPFNVAAAVKYSAEYEWRSRNPGISPEAQIEFSTVAANLAYDAVAEAADAAELCAEIAAITNDIETAELAASLANGYHSLAYEFVSTRIRTSEKAAAGGRLGRAASAASRASRSVKRLEP